MSEYKGVFPNTYNEIISLKGVGAYTAAAIASIAFGETVAVVDGNVKRVISRIYGLELTGTALQKQVMQIMTIHLDKQRPGDFNQAVMEFGALHCTPKNPLCTPCIFKSDCLANQKGIVERLPVREVKIKSKTRHFSYLVAFSDNQGIILQKRSEADIWRNLYEFPLLESKSECNPQQIMQDPKFISWFGENARINDSTSIYKHKLTHQTILARFHFVIPENVESILKNQKWELISKKDMNKYPVSRLIERFLKDHQSRIAL
jgi:A/G-specific adenine glycosylase